MHWLRSRLYKPPDQRVFTIFAGLDSSLQAQSDAGRRRVAIHSCKNALFELFLEQYGSDAVAQALALKTLNISLARYHYRSRGTSLLSRPFGLVVDSTNVCHLTCPGCVHSRRSRELGLFDWKPGMLSEDRVGKLLRRFGPYAIQTLYYSYGEPLLNPATPRFIRLARRYLSQTMLSTSLSIPRFDAEAYVRSGLDYMILSIDGATQPVYERFRQRGRLDLVLRHAAALVEAKRRLGRHTPILCWQFLAFEHNLHEAEIAMRMARDLGLDEFTLAQPFDVSWDDPEIRAAEVETRTTQFNVWAEEDMIENWKSCCGDLDTETIAREFETAWLGTSEIEAPRNSPHACRWLYKNIAMDANGRIFPCSCAPASGREGTFALLDDGNPGDVFNSEKHRLARLFFADSHRYRHERTANGGSGAPPCAECEWNGIKADVDGDQIRHFLKASGGALFNAASVELLASW